MFGPLLDVQMSFCVAGARDCAPCQKWAKRDGFVACLKTMAGVGHLKRICKDAFSVTGALQETCSSELLGGPGADFLRKVTFWSIRSSVLGRWFLRDRCSTCTTFRGRRNTLDRWSGKNPFHVWRKSGRIASLLTWATSKIEDVSQNCFVFVVKIKNEGRLAE